jgi:enoyl-CoA hydratase/carnithine racemase
VKVYKIYRGEIMSTYAMTYKHLKVELKKTHQLWVTLDNPTQSNAITNEMIDSLTTVLKKADFDPIIRVIIITGSGKNFCSGGDIKAMEEQTGMFQGESNELRNRYMHGIQQIPKVIEEISTPLIALVNGAAIGAGCDLSMMCDLRVGTKSTKFGETFTKMGLVPGDGGTFFLSRVIGFSKAMQMFLTAETFEGQKAYEFGLLNFLFEDSNVLAETEKLADRISNLSPVAMSMTKKAMKISYLHDLQTSLDVLASFQGISQRTHDHFEAIQAFKEKRIPSFKGN